MKTEKRKYSCAGNVFLSVIMMLCLRFPALTPVRRAEAVRSELDLSHCPPA